MAESSVSSSPWPALDLALASTIRVPTVGKRTSKARNKKIREKLVYDILKIDENIKTAFNNEKHKLPVYKSRLFSILSMLKNTEKPSGINIDILTELEMICNNYEEKHDGKIGSDNTEIMKSLKLTYREFVDLYEQVIKLQKTIDNISSNQLYDTYMQLTSGIIEKYKQILATPVKVNFLSKLKSEDKDQADKQKIELRTKYINIAKNFIDIDDDIESAILDTQKYKCRCDNSTDFEDIGDGLLTCEHCGEQVDKMSSNTNFRDIDRINLHIKYRYAKISHFRECVAQYQGKQNKIIDPSLFTKADEWLKIHSLLNSSSTIKKERYKHVRKEHIRIFISELENDKNRPYEDLNLFYSQLTGNPPPDISHLELKLFEQFDKLVEAFLSLNDISRTNFLNSQFTLHRLLILNGYIPDPQDFPGLKTIARIHEHEAIFSSLLEITGIGQKL